MPYKSFILDVAGARSFDEATAAVHARVKKAVRKMFAEGKGGEGGGT